MSEYPKRLTLPSPPRMVDGALMPQPPVILTVKNADQEARWIPRATLTAAVAGPATEE